MFHKLFIRNKLRNRCSVLAGPLRPVPLPSGLKDGQRRGRRGTCSAPRGQSRGGHAVNSSARNLPVCDALHAATSSGVPQATTSPPAWPPSGPRSMTWSAVLITSRWCSITTTVWPGVDQPVQALAAAARRRRGAGRSSARRGCRRCASTRCSLLSSVGDLDALRLAAGERRRRLAERQVAEPEIVQHLDLLADRRLVREERRRLPRPTCSARRRWSCRGSVTSSVSLLKRAPLQAPQVTSTSGMK